MVLPTYSLSLHKYPDIKSIRIERAQLFKNRLERLCEISPNTLKGSKNLNWYPFSVLEHTSDATSDAEAPLRFCNNSEVYGILKNTMTETFSIPRLKGEVTYLRGP